MITDDDLLLYQYNDGFDAADRARIRNALATQPELRVRLQRLIATLDQSKNLPEIAVPESARLRWKSSLNGAANALAKTQMQPPRSRHLSWRYGVVAFGVAALAVSVALSVYFPRTITPPPAPASASASTSETNLAANQQPASGYERRLRWHLLETEQQLDVIVDASRETRAELIEQVIIQNQRYASAADRANEPQLARVLRSFTPTLTTLNDDRIAKSEFDGALAQLKFELKVVQARLSKVATASITNTIANVPHA
jgi:hypothetical protein